MSKWYSWFQDLKKEDNEDRWFNFRGSFGPRKNNIRLRYQLCSGPAFKYSIGEDEEDGGMKCHFSLLFVTVYLGLNLFKCPKFLEGKYCSLYWYENTIWWNWLQLHNGSSSRTPWYKSFNINILEMCIGKTLFIKNDYSDACNQYFTLGGKLFKINKIQWSRHNKFYSRIPFALFNKEFMRVDIKIADPPMRSGKGTTSYNCSDDGSYGLYGPWEHGKFRYDKRNAAIELAVNYYVANVVESANRYGGSNGDRGIKATDEYEFIGIIPSTKRADSNGEAVGPIQ